jgi:3-phenylpropionate/cinnamic acid dioxygenase small subunit
VKQWGSNVSELDILARIDALQTRYVRALDKREMDTWVDCFADEAGYVCITRENVEQDLPLALMLDDTKARIKDRANYVTQVWAGTFEDYTTRHFVQRLDCKQLAPSLYEIESNFMVAYTSARGKSELLVAGAYVDQVTLESGEPKFKSKKSVIDTVTTPRYLVYPV